MRKLNAFELGLILFCSWNQGGCSFGLLNRLGVFDREDVDIEDAAEVIQGVVDLVEKRRPRKGDDQHQKASFLKKLLSRVPD